jgi:hypothetical protein
MTLEFRTSRWSRRRVAAAVAALAGPMLFAGISGAASADGEYAFVLTTDYYSAAYYSTVELLPPRDVHASISSVSTDAVAYYDESENMVFVVNRFLADNIQIVDPGSGFATVGQYSVGNGSNPHDIRLAGGKAYVTRYEWGTLFICDPYTGDSLGAIDLTPFADSDGIPEMDRMAVAGGRLFVTLNSLDRQTWLPDGPGKIAVIDVEADTLVDADPGTAGLQPIVLALPNPYGELRYDPCRDELAVGCLGAWGMMDGGVEVIDASALVSKGVIITELDLGGDVSDAVLGPGTKGYAVVMDSMPWPDNFARLAAFDRETGEVTDTLYIQKSGSGAALAGIELNRQRELYLCDRHAAMPRVRVYDTLADTLIASLDVGLPPFDIAFVQTAHAEVAGPIPGGGASASMTLTACPNPARAGTGVRFIATGFAGDEPLRIRVYDVAGRLVRCLEGGVPGSTAYRSTWDGLDESGRRLAEGVYYCRISSGRAYADARVVLLR